MKHRSRHADPAHQSKASRRYHDRVARKYDAIYDDPYWRFHDQLTWAAVKPHLPRDLSAKCCDLGCGTGKWGLKLLKSGFATTLVDNSAAMIEQARDKAAALGPHGRKASLLVADMVNLSELPADSFALTLAMGDPLSICNDPPQATREMFRITQPGGIVIATADNKLAALSHYVEAGDFAGLTQLVRTGRTNWLTNDERERFELTTFTPGELRKMFEKAGFEVVSIHGKTILPIREFREQLKEDPQAFDVLMELEMELGKDQSAAARAGHLQIVGRKG